MEGTANLRTTIIPLTKSEQKTLIILIIIFHAVGLIGFAVPALYSLFLDLVPFHLLLMVVFVAGSHRPADGKFFLFMGILFLAGYGVEWLGVKGDWLFGKYAYGPTLGTKLDDVPLCIGVNWFLLIYSTGIFMKMSRVRSIASRIIIGAFILVLLDLLIEPVAIQLGYWHWNGNSVPIRNYVAWFFVSAIFLFVFESFQFKKQSTVAPVFLATQFAFFILLHLILILL